MSLLLAKYLSYLFCITEQFGMFMNKVTQSDINGGQINWIIHKQLQKMINILEV